MTLGHSPFARLRSWMVCCWPLGGISGGGHMTATHMNGRSAVSRYASEWLESDSLLPFCSPQDHLRKFASVCKSAINLELGTPFSLLAVLFSPTPHHIAGRFCSFFNEKGPRGHRRELVEITSYRRFIRLATAS
ncbi:hypothetical protein GE09DRAFT_1088202 [Coniochaeta sp. 2T2.1]|nr:hypothetical protein GE09DRAFT_1088202 [Coniochaeta sp. 2T2.1]